MAFGEDDDNIEDGEDVCEETYDDTDDFDDTRDEIDRASTPLVRSPVSSSFSLGMNDDNKGPSRPLRLLFSCTDVCTSEGLMPSFPAGRLPFIVCAAVGAASLSAIALFYLSVSKVRR
jgi:hypothetical protein